MSGVAVVFGLCALSFAAGCVLTAVMLRRDQPPEPTPEPAPAPPPPPRFEPRLPPDDYATKPIHRNPVMGLPTALPAPRPARPNLVLVPDPPPGAELPVRQDAVRRMHVVRPDPAPVVPTGSAAEGAEPAEPVVERAEPAERATTPETVAGPAERAGTAGPAGNEARAHAAETGTAPGDSPRAVEAARRESNR
ncbi:hypothetical protein AB0425_28135 [Actinosynnema sp. NPDC051121]|nr:hypothetical protein [Saccharothrix sp.]